MAKLTTRSQVSGLLTVAIALTLSQACARSQPLQPPDASSPSGSRQQLPFHSAADRIAAPEATAAAPDAKSTTALPFRNGLRPRSLPLGSLLTVQLANSLSTSRVRAGDTFTASLSSPLLLDGDTVIARGAPVVGRVESTQSGPGLGYFRLTLSAITVEGKNLELQTSSLFARGSIPVSNQATRGVNVQRGRRLTFRLTAPVNLDPSPAFEPPATASSPTSSPTK